jgi:hypothetical protein
MSQGITFFTTGIHHGLIYADDLIELADELEELASAPSKNLASRVQAVTGVPSEPIKLADLQEEVGKAIEDADRDEDMEELSEVLQSAKESIEKARDSGQETVSLVEEGEFVASRYLQHIAAEWDVFQQPEMESILSLNSLLNSPELDPDEMEYHAAEAYADRIGKLIGAFEALPDDRFNTTKEGLLGDLADLEESINEAKEKNLKFCLCSG